MLTFFRRIRKGLLEGGATSKYLLYAIGEIALVVIGILIALQINNWNDERKEQVLETKIYKQLYDELLNCHIYSKGEYDEYRTQSRLLEHFISKGESLNIDSFIVQTGQLWPVETFSLSTYLIDFTGFYDPSLNFYNSSINDGTISILKDKNFVYRLENIYVKGKNRMDRLYEREIQLNREIGNYISDKYGELLRSEGTLKHGKWDAKSETELLRNIVKDGTIRYRLRDKLILLYSKLLILDRDVMLPIQEFMETYDYTKE